MTVLALPTALSSSAFPMYLPQYSQNDISWYAPFGFAIHNLTAEYLGLNSTSNLTHDEAIHASYKRQNKHVLAREHEIGEDIPLKSFAKSSTKVKIKIKKVEQLGIIV